MHDPKKPERSIKSHWIPKIAFAVWIFHFCRTKWGKSRGKAHNWNIMRNSWCDLCHHLPLQHARKRWFAAAMMLGSFLQPWNVFRQPKRKLNRHNAHKFQYSIYDKSGQNVCKIIKRKYGNICGKNQEIINLGEMGMEEIRQKNWLFLDLWGRCIDTFMAQENN